MFSLRNSATYQRIIFFKPALTTEADPVMLKPSPDSSSLCEQYKSYGSRKLKES